MSLPKNFDYRKTNNQLEQILERIQSNDVDIDEAIKLFEQGTALINQLQEYLKTVENKVTKIKPLSSKNKRSV